MQLQRSKRYSQFDLIKYGLLTLLAISILIVGLLEASLKDSLAINLDKLIVYSLANDGTHSNLSIHSLRIVNFAYRLLYCGICLFIIHIYSTNRVITKLAVILYGSLLCLITMLYTVAQMSQVEPLRIVAFRMDTLLVSPMPVILLISASFLRGKTSI